MITVDYILIWLGFLGAVLSLTAFVAAACSRFERRFFQRFLPRTVFAVIFFALGALALYSVLLRLMNVEPFWFFPYTAALAAFYAIFSMALLSRGFNAGKAWALNRRKKILALCLIISVVVSNAAWEDVESKSQDIFEAWRAESAALAKGVIPPRPPADQDAASLYEKAGKLRGKDKLSSIPISVPKYLVVTEEERALPGKKRETLALLRQAAGRPHLYQHIDPSDLWLSLIESPIADFSTFSYFARLLFLSGREKALKGDFKGAYDDIQCIGSISRQLKETPAMLSFAMAGFLNRIHMTALEYVLANAAPPENFFGLPMEISQSTIGDFKKTMIMEMAFGLEVYSGLGMKKAEAGDLLSAILPVFADDLDDLDELRLKTPLFLWRVSFFTAEYGEHVRRMRGFLKVLDEPYFKVADSLYAWEEKEKRLPRGLYDNGSTHTEYFPLVLKLDAQNRLESLALALTAYRSDKGTYPKNLKELAPAYISSVPLDPFDGKPMKMEEVKGGLRIFSVGRANEPLDFFLGKDAYRSYRLNQGE